jgi:hypothetical protein
VLTLNESNDLIQGEVMDSEKKIKDPNFALFDFGAAVRASARGSVVYRNGRMENSASQLKSLVSSFAGSQDGQPRTQ